MPIHLPHPNYIILHYKLQAMQQPKVPQNELERLDALLSYKVLDTGPENDFDEITRLASEICETSISVITLLDEKRQWFKSKIGLDINETPREVSFCGHAINQPYENFIIENALEDARFADNPLVTEGVKIRSYAGVPLLSPDGFPLGTLCVIDNRPKKFNDFQVRALETLANQAMKLLELRKNNFKLRESHNLLAQRYKDLEQFSHVVSHDIKSPLNNIMMLANVFKEEYGEKLDEQAFQMVGYIGQSAEKLKKLVDSMLEYYKYDTIDVESREKIRLHEFTKYIIGLLHAHDETEFVLPDQAAWLRSNTMAFGQILYNLIGNAIKYNDKAKARIEIGLEQRDLENIIFVKDNGIGIAKGDLNHVFEAFNTLGKTDRYNEKGTGLGLSTVQKLVTKLGGSITIESEEGNGTTFYIHLKK